MGHGVEAALTATLCLGGLRNARNAGAPPPEPPPPTTGGWGAPPPPTPLGALVPGVAGGVAWRPGFWEVVSAVHAAPSPTRGSRPVPWALPGAPPLGLLVTRRT